ncbi:hypothetical protein AB0F81_14750 [Actinoplanes sp. NPDC024001]|uniref:hypothetical protein n=1 Tax=Actinoplanes sp. NPDC024001 TaxID=3154598 RepID=UPI0033F5B03B
MSSNAEPNFAWPSAANHVTAAELARRQGVQPVASIDDLARPDLFESDDDLDEFLTDVYASRRAGIAWAW